MKILNHVGFETNLLLTHFRELLIIIGKRVNKRVQLGTVKWNLMVILKRIDFMFSSTACGINEIRLVAN